MNTTLWVFQGLLTTAFLMAGMMKATLSKEKLEKTMLWVKDFSSGTVKLIGTIETIGAIGLVLPMLTNILPILTPLAATGLSLTMIAAVIVHLRIKDYKGMIPSIFLLVMALIVAYGRFTF